MRISVFGLGYVGCVSGACLANMGHDVIGVDVNPDKLDTIRSGQSPIIEPGLSELLSAVVKNGKLTVTSDVEEAIRGSEISMVCVGTPSRLNGSLDTHYLDRVMEQIGGVLAKMDEFHVVAIRSTTLPGLVAERIVPLLEASSGKVAGEGFGVCVNPEFLRESTAIEDFKSPPFTVIGEYNKKSGDVMSKLYEDLPAPIYRIDPGAAAMVKYASNAYHALKVAFGNEIGSICKEFDIDGQAVMDVFCQDKQLNISRAYLRPGFAFGGSCLPKDVRALQYSARHRDVNVPLMHSIIPSNDVHIQRALNMIFRQNKRKIAMLGLSFKPGTDDLRESPLVRLAETLIGKGYELSIFDKEVSLSNLFGHNRAYIEEVLPHIHSALKEDVEAVVRGSEVLVVGKRFNHLEQIRPHLRDDHVVIDLIRMEGWGPAQHECIV